MFRYESRGNLSIDERVDRMVVTVSCAKMSERVNVMGYRVQEQGVC
jgi:hypothetical protein